jgi:imidazolonepropionase-like amidohydrolase
MAHAHGAEGIKNALRAGVASIEHGTWLDEEAIGLMKRSGAFLVPTMVASQWVLRYAELSPGSVLPQSARKAAESIEQKRRSVGDAIAQGVRVAFGTDSGVGPHGRNTAELALLVDAGMTPMQAIVAATSTASQCLQMQDSVGTVECGKLADLLMVDGDPLADIAILENRSRLLLIMQGGRIHKRALTA